jgi:hypothetical protein
MRWRLRAASVCATEIDSTKPMIEISTAGPIKAAPDEIGEKARHGQRRQALRHLAHDVHALSLSPSSPGGEGGDDDRGHRSRPWLSDVGKFSVSRPSISKSGFSPLRTQNRKAVALTPITSVIGLTSPMCSFSEPICSGRLAPGRMPRMCLQLADGDQDSRRGDEAGDDRMRQEIGEKAQPEHAQQDQECRPK